MKTFTATLDIIGVNPFVYVPQHILDELFVAAGKEKGHIPICGEVNGKPYKQTLVRFDGEWRLYVNLYMLKNSPKRVGEKLTLSIALDKESRVIKPHPKLMEALEENSSAKEVFLKLSPSKQKEIVRYIANLKSEESVDKNVVRAVDFLLGKGRFVGRDKP